MKTLRKLVVLAVAVLALALAAACGGGDGDDGGNRPGAGADGTPVQRNSPSPGASSGQGGGSKALTMEPSEVLGLSAQSFNEDVQSVAGDMSFDMTFAGFSAGAGGEFAFDAPDRLYLTMRMSGTGPDMPSDFGDLGTFEMLMTGGNVYVNSVFTGWVVMSPEDLGVEGKQFQELLSEHSPLDYESLLDEIGGEVEYLGTGQIDGEPFDRYRATVQVTDILDAVSESFGDSGAFDSDVLGDFYAGPISIDVWVHPESSLPRRLQAAGTFGNGDQAAAFEMTMNFTDYNGPVQIPEPPADARPFTEITGSDFGFGDGSGE